MTERVMRGFAPLYLQLRSWFLIPVGVVLFALTLTIGLVAKSYGSYSPDLAVDVEMSEERNPVVNAIGLGIHYGLGPLGAVIILAGICVWLMFARRAPILSLAFGSIIAVGWLSSEIGKFTVTRLRPPHGVVHALITEPGHDSFPSGHTAFAAALAWAVILVLTRPGIQRRWTILTGILFTALPNGRHRICPHQYRWDPDLARSMEQPPRTPATQQQAAHPPPPTRPIHLIPGG